MPYLAYTAKTEKFKLDIFQDDDGGSSNPRDYDGHFVMVTWEDRYGSPDANDWDSFASFRKDWMPKLSTRCPNCGNDGTLESMERYYANAGWKPQTIERHRIERDGTYRTCTWCGEEWEKGPGEGKDGFCLTIERSGYDGSISVAGNLDEWSEGDRDPDGVVFATADKIQEYMGYTEAQYRKHFDGKGKAEVVLSQLRGEVEEYSNWAVGNVYGYVLSKAQQVHVTVKDNTTGDTLTDEDEDRWEELDSCWGFITSDPDKDVPAWGDIAGWLDTPAEFEALKSELHYV